MTAVDMDVDPKIRRRRQEKLRLAAWLAPRRHAVRLLRATGDAPTNYHLRYFCTGATWVQPVTGEYRTRPVHDVHIQLSSTYPMRPPAVFIKSRGRMHPNIKGNGRVCLGEYWTMQRTLDQLADVIWKVLVWDPVVTNSTRPDNPWAARWLEDHRHLTPFDWTDPMEPPWPHLRTAEEDFPGITRGPLR